MTFLRDGFECKLTKMDQTDIRWEYTLEGQCPDGTGNVVQLDGPDNEQQEKPAWVTDDGNTVPPPLAVWLFGSCNAKKKFKLIPF